MADLTPFEDKEVASVGVEIPNAAGGLQDAMKFDPVELHHGDEGYLVLHWSVAKVRFDPIPKTEALRRVHVFHAEDAALIDADLVAEHLAKQRERIETEKARLAREKEREQGVETLPGADGRPGVDDEEEERRILSIHHAQGLHADPPKGGGMVPGCQECDDERDAEERERAADVAAKADAELAAAKGDGAKAPDEVAAARKRAAAKKSAAKKSAAKKAAPPKGPAGGK